MLYEHKCDQCGTHATVSCSVADRDEPVRCNHHEGDVLMRRLLPVPQLITDTFRDQSRNASRERGEIGSKDQVDRMKQDEQRYQKKHRKSGVEKKEVSMADIGQKAGVFA